MKMKPRRGVLQKQELCLEVKILEKYMRWSLFLVKKILYRYFAKILTISAYVSLTASDFSNDTNYMKCCSNGKNDNTSKRNKICLTGQKTLSKNAKILAEKELCN